MIIYAVSCVASMPISLAVIKRVGKVQTYRLAMIGVCIYGALAFVATYVSYLLLALAAVILGLVLGAVNVLGDVFLSDVVSTTF